MDTRHLIDKVEGLRTSIKIASSIISDTKNIIQNFEKININITS